MPLGYKHTEETKIKIREKRKQQIMPSPSLETRQKMSSWQIGKIMSEETRKKISKTKKERPRVVFEEERLKMSERMIGNTFNLGKKFPNKTMPKASIETRKKMSEAHKGEKCYSWKGGITEENHLIRKGVENKLWRKSVFARDSYTCCKCGNLKEKLNAHHINNFSSCVEDRFLIDNGITLCQSCHKKFHREWGIINNNKSQLEEFLNPVNEYTSYYMDSVAVREGSDAPINREVYSLSANRGV